MNGSRARKSGLIENEENYRASGRWSKVLAILMAIAFMVPAGINLYSLGGSVDEGKASTTALMDPGGIPHYFGPYPNYANSPLPTGPITSIVIEKGGSKYSSPIVNIEDVYGTGTGASATATVVGGVIIAINLVSGGTGYSAPIVSISDPTGTGAIASATIGGVLDGGIRKFVDSLPGLSDANANNLGNYLSLAFPDKATFPGCDYYEIAVVEYTQKLHSDLPPTLLRGYVQLETSANYAVSKHVVLQNPDSTPILLANGTQAIGVDYPSYLGPTILSMRDIPARIKFSNLLPTGIDGDLFIPVDTTVMGAGMGALGMVHHVMVMNGGSGYISAPSVNLVGGGGMGATAEATIMDGAVHHIMVTNGGMGYSSAPTVELIGGGGSGAVVEAMVMYDNYTQNRATLHLHGGFVPWISDGTPHQWTTPAGEATQYPKGVSVQYVPDMWFVNGSVVPNTVGQTTPPVVGATNNPGDGSLTFYYNNQQSARLMFYHDHSYGITRLNVYAGEAAGYLLTDTVEEELIDSGVIPNIGGVYRYGIPLVIQDKSFVDATTIAYQDPTWAWGSQSPGIPTTGDLWMPHVYMPNQNPWDIDGMNAYGRWHYGPWFWPPTQGVTYGPVPNPYYDPINAPWEPPMNPGVPSNSMAMEAFMDTPTVNGGVYPYLDVNPQAYRFRILSVANDRFFNLQMYVADSSVVTSDGRANTEVRMVPAVTTPGFPELWPTDGREGGVPDPATAGPGFVQIGTEGGFLPAPVLIENQPVTWNLDPTTFNMGNVQDHALLLGPAERADVIIDFSAFAGKTIILYNDAPAAFPARDPRYDYYTGNPDLTDSGGTPPTQPGYGPNTRTIMQFRVADVNPATPFNFEALCAMFAKTPTKNGVFESSQDPIIVPQAAYNSAYDKSFPEDAFARIMDKSLTFQTISGETRTISFEMKAIQDEMGEAFDPDYGRMSGMLGIEYLSGTAGMQNFMLYPFPSPPVDLVTVSLTAGEPIAGDGTQIWKITHNGVDTHTLHTHLFSMQLINRVAWDNAVSPPDPNELGWKETLRVNPLEATIVAIRPVYPTQPFEVPNSVRPIDPTMPLGTVLVGPPGGFQDVQASPVTVVNHLINYGWEYVMHCHLLGHEEMDMMHEVSVAVPAFSPTNFTGVLAGTAVNLTWIDNSKTETGFIVQRNTTIQPWTDIAYIPSPLNGTSPTTGTLFYLNDTIVADGTVYYYRVLATKLIGDTEIYLDSVGFPKLTVNSTPLNLLEVDTGLGNVTDIPIPPVTAPGPVPQLMSGPNTYSPAPSSLVQLASLQVGGATTFTPHSPIRIDSNADFDVAHGVTGGNGTSWAPWIIEGYYILGGGTGCGIFIGNTTDYFIVRNNTLDLASGWVFDWTYSPASGIAIYNSTNGIVANNIMSANSWAGASLYLSHGIVLFNNSIFGNYMGVYLHSSGFITLANNELMNNFAGIWLYRSDSNNLTNNKIYLNYPGIALVDSGSNEMLSNSIFYNKEYGISIQGSSSNNSIYGNSLRLNNGSNTTYSATHIQAFDGSGANLWNGTSAGNLWYDWTAPDLDLNGIVDIPYAIAGGIGAMDNYPLIAAPVCTITSPTSSSTYSTNWGWIKLIGTAEDDVAVTSVVWANDRGGSGTMYMTPQFGGPSVSWQSRGSVQLFAGSNVITAVALDSLGHTGMDVLEVVYDTTMPVCTISSPTSNSAYLTNLANLTISGTASDASGISEVKWKNMATGASGTAAGSTSWSVTSLLLNVGTNLIYVNATDAAGNKGSDAIFVTLDLGSVAVTITAPTTNPTMTTGWHMIYLRGTATDDVKITKVTWSNSLGGSGIAYMTPQWGAPSVTWQSRGNVMLYPGVNVITVTAFDIWGNTATDTLTVTYTGV